MTQTEPFKMCQLCRTHWDNREQFVADPQVVLVGYQANFVVPARGLFLFDHACRNTLSVDVWTFADLYEGEVFEESRRGTEECPGYCLHENDLRPCPAHCECAYVREILALLQQPRETLIRQLKQVAAAQE